MHFWTKCIILMHYRRVAYVCTTSCFIYKNTSQRVLVKFCTAIPFSKMRLWCIHYTLIFLIFYLWGQSYSHRASFNPIQIKCRRRHRRFLVACFKYLLISSLIRLPWRCRYGIVSLVSGSPARNTMQHTKTINTVNHGNCRKLSSCGSVRNCRETIKSVWERRENVLVQCLV
jgi:hypothetical protein